VGVGGMGVSWERVVVFGANDSRFYLGLTDL